ncbi:response regulator [Novosphingobium sp. RD2P27]|uniref:Response regulator n=1 Tax=Novosphingobium kalidii TaxID=3230299 RepID=A0ABV2D3S5_9SPHN
MNPSPDQSLAVLVVEDEGLLRICVADALQDAGLTVFEAVNATEALELLDARDDVRVVLTDIEMPGDIDGLALTATIHQRWPEIGVVVVSGRVRPDPGQLPANGEFIAKPYDLNEVTLRVSQMLEDT